MEITDFIIGVGPGKLKQPLRGVAGVWQLLGAEGPGEPRRRQRKNSD